MLCLSAPLDEHGSQLLEARADQAVAVLMSWLQMSLVEARTNISSFTLLPGRLDTIAHRQQAVAHNHTPCV